ncbi:MAG: YdbL family protein [Thiotrichaceae bacterium]
MRYFIRFPLVIWLGLFLAACVTINVYFPAAAAEKAADQIIDKVWGDDASKSSDPKKPSDTQKTPSSSLGFSTQWLTAMQDWAVTPAHAAEANLDISSDEIIALQNSLAKRFKQLNSYYDSGAVGLTNDGMVELHDASLVPLNVRAQVNKLIQGENKDRQNLYREIASANGHPEWADQIQRTFAKRWIDRSTKGWWYQNPQGNWKQK